MMVGKKKTFVYILLVIWSIINLFPIYFMFTFSLKGNDEIFGANIIGLPQHWLWSNYSSALGTGNMALYFFNSLLVTVVSIGISIIAAMMATYALTRIKWRLSKLTNAFFMLGLTIPLQASIVPVYVVLSKLHWLNKYSTLIVPYSAFTLSMSILICTGFMVDIPYDLDEAAIIDGCGLFGTFFKIIMPLMKPALSTVGIYAYLQCWNEFMFANVFISDQKHRTLPVGIKALSGAYTTDWGPIGAALVIATFPTLIAYVFLSRKIQDSFIAGAVKG
ncbi:MAG: carbohydrate ABC transporter permease [Butyrivibrio sp.]|jgi:raffinose/stachyose/melibiose transport system permease protein|uniref:Raffinose/stachyose/melibiose transport system permease protein n=1 Tax=Butyrivibrio hungatei TaxID=185008 RepID=A0A1G5DTV3_9FIRM|nr:carbohydrate ABC transporter permease [Butyrivibrio hungatei]MBR4356787.1 carbohydrate ABC transporter permease [Butyrivibrio sp.]MBR4667402.1 carbohydrate ABC transporter permease [Butyrivibrio sp.]MCR4996461.1 carbohydrate ABC transporter permease [Butyrivibrio sp.]MEE3470089.1 carbohydrate ABC transporter permease [Butyrivibrio hungatei]SCY18152.1 raffinose/stachyose/melibiose transport system permease protein [Butyrivibrio hungatei]